MFSLHVHALYEASKPRVLICTSSDGRNPSSSSGGNYIEVKPIKLQGVVHLFGKPPLGSICPTIRKSSSKDLIFVVAVPNYFYAYDFLQLCGIHLNGFENVTFILNDASEDMYSVLISLEDGTDPQRFYSACNGKRFKPDGNEICHIYFIQSVRFTGRPGYAARPPEGFMELPSCPVCLERLDLYSSGIQDKDTSRIHSNICDNSFDSWNNLSCQVCQVMRQQQQFDRPSCQVCGISKNLRICFICGFVNYERCKEEPRKKHWNAEHHHLALDLETQKIRDCVRRKFVHR